jgi:hypothetical protein
MNRCPAEELVRNQLDRRERSVKSQGMLGELRVLGD